MARVLRIALTWGLYPAAMIGALAVVELVYRAGLDPLVGAGLVIGVLSAAVHMLEQIVPYRASWRVSRGELRTDVCHFMFSNGFAQLAQIATVVGVAALGERLSLVAIWPTTWPLVAQVGVALLVTELGAYALHRLQHERGLLWRLHAVHHSAHRLYWLTGARNHPFDLAIGFAIAASPVVLLGAGEHVLLLLGTLTIVATTLQHANLDVRLGPLEGWLNVVAVHRHHHSAQLAEANANYGGLLLVWDRVFGTYRAPGADVGDVGLVDRSELPSGYLAQLASPFTTQPRSAPRP